jgi:hypothetical protein
VRSQAVATALVTVLLSSLARGQTPLGTAFTYQGRLESAGQPVNGAANIVFELYDASAAGSLLGTQSLNAVTVADGLFTVGLNAAGEFGPSAFTGDRRWLEITVNGTPLVPRQELTATPYALQTRGLYVDNVGRVGIGTTTPLSLLSIDGGLTLRDVLDEDVAIYTGNFYVNNGDTNIPAYHYTSDPEQHEFSVGGALSLKIASNGNVGIRVANPLAALDIGGTAKVSANAGIAFDVSNASTTAGAMAIRGFETGLTGNTYGVFGVANSTAGVGVFGRAAAGSGATSGVYGQNMSTSGYGVYGAATSASGISYGVYGTADSPSGYGVRGTSVDNVGVRGDATGATGLNYGVYGTSTSTGGIGVFGTASSTTGTTYGGYFRSSSTDGFGVLGLATASSGDTVGVRGESHSTSGWGVIGEVTATTGQTYGVRGVVASTTGRGVLGWASSQTGVNYGVQGQSNSSEGKGVYGLAGSFDGVPYGVYGKAYGDGIAVYAEGDFAASGSKAFRIDHPDDPQNRYLLHYCAESPEVINFYRGTAVLDGAGEAVVELPGYFAKINKTPSYQLTAIGAPMPNLHVAEEISGAALSRGERAQPGETAPLCTFRIAGGAASGKVSWRVEAVRNDLRMRAKGAPIEREKQGAERGKYQYPELYGQPSKSGMDYGATP